MKRPPPIDKSNWIRASSSNLCPNCKHDHGCLVSPDRQVASCFDDGNNGKLFYFTKANGTAGRNLNGTTTYTGAANRQGSATKTTRGSATAEGAIASAVKGVGGVLVATYNYTDAFKILRIESTNKTKEIRPISLGKDGWVIKDPPEPLPLYRTNEIPREELIWTVSEGEKCKDLMEGLGFVAFTSSHGADSAARSDWSRLSDATVTIAIFPDHDESGERYARDVCRIIFQRNPNAKIKIVRLPGLPAGGDIEQFIESRPDRSPEKIKIEIMWQIHQSPLLTPADYVGGPVMICAASIEPRQVYWLWKNRFPLGRLSLVVGAPGCGKSFLMAYIAACLTTQTPWADGTECPSGSVILCNPEDDGADTTVPRLMAHGADLRRVHLVSMVRRIGEDGKPHEVMLTLEDLPAIESALQRNPDCRAMCLDPIGSLMGASTDSHRDNEVRALLAPLSKLAEKYNVAIIIVAHRRKATGSSADDLAMGSRAFTGICRVVLHLSRDPQNKSRRLLLTGKNNLAVEGDGLAFTIAGDPPCIRWEKEPVKMSADEALSAENGSTEEGSERAEAKSAAVEWLESELSDMLKHPVSDLQAAAKDASINWRTVQRASNTLKIIRDRSQFQGGYSWRLRPSTSGNHGTLGTLERKSFNDNDSTTVPTNGTVGGTLGHSLACQHSNGNGTLESEGTLGELERIQGNNDDSLSLGFLENHTPDVLGEECPI